MSASWVERLWLMLEERMELWRVRSVIGQVGDSRRFSVLDMMLPWNWNGGVQPDV